MIISEGYFYHISDDYFVAASDSTLMSNYENVGYRPHYFAIRDSSNSDIFWMVPVSSQYGKYKSLHDKMAAKYGRCTKIVLGKCGGKDAAYLIQNAFPITSDYLDHIHTLQGSPLTLHASTARTVVDYLNNNLLLHKRGVHLFFADIDRLLQLMTDHLAYTKNTSDSKESENTDSAETDSSKEDDSANTKALEEETSSETVSSDTSTPSDSDAHEASDSNQ